MVLSGFAPLPIDLSLREQQMEWDVPQLRSAQSRLARVIELLKLPEDILEKLSFPKRAIVSSIPVRLDDGKLKVFAGYLVTHSDTLGPSQGQLRFHSEVSLGEVAALAMSQTWKCGLVGVPLGGAQAGVRCSPDQLSIGEIERITRRFTTEMVPVIGPDQNVLSPGLGTDERMMAWIMDTYSQIKGRAIRQIVTGKPRIIGGTPRRDGPGRSMTCCIVETAAKLKLNLNEETRIVIQGFGKLGKSVHKMLSKLNCKVIAINDIRGGIINEKGLNYDDLEKYVEQHGYLFGYKNAQPIDNESLLTLPCDFLILAATSDQITRKNAHKIRARVIAEGATEATSAEADAILNERGVFIIPDILAIAGDIILSYFEWVQGLQSYMWDEREVNQKLEKIIQESFHRVYHLAQAQKIDMRTAGIMAGVAKVADAIQTRGIYP